ncbi:MAG: alpha/beta hydrolase [Rhizobiales bacterium]|nr:alpha/beta hydrolase [Hyphomicrobiales bacterium]MBO6697448.1 alpha/beta hydrolase [Hyphomicrobiales bacterium]MBO6736297.1 alpha/beta hydrolase [Hyphomicrobiales bacterium]MBO6912767.1 alpha/beta hydrolase [Hyphomicrobiales bacterium]MBO6953936.1 alpha/beta hydrolase [Hyphomicrobiales bacterium]
MSLAARQLRSPLSADPLFPGFEVGENTGPDGVTIRYVKAGSGPAVLLLHGYPQNRAMWAKVAPKLVDNFTVIAADLRGYGASDKPEPTPDAENYAFRVMANDMAALMTALGHETFHLVGHDRGARVGHRFALDHPNRLLSLTLMDIIPTIDVWVNMDTDLSVAYWHWPFLAQPLPFPAALIGADPDMFFETCLKGWGKAKLEDFDPAMLDAYRQAWRDPAMIAASCGDYRAGAMIDYAHDDVQPRAKIACPLLVMEGLDGVMGQRFNVIGIWKQEATGPVSHAPMPGGHFFIDLHPEKTLDALQAFLTDPQRATQA